ncbi:hypothetical protein TPHA_0J00820 [Tetrapisispora phaffii CBS 4417]|uniref:non-specific serine/threonine protein kinase n=1 Tax=Tetrapisispora phaffii (strain ATCC 24235 / CBS 4417 / NBRC 1672 / NRRL Y-8282 / UCD 70-5) TaxID=1071381 RepID=G8BYG3_TETPH|nr:hypothetical protein TPHA_0J00820 [Tetrapisispora phaffii CBS 4417]CCE64905.1 hypothetical protein TPHA_0J00820 [Tetrapisispora phaffii CBS 4417]
MSEHTDDYHVNTKFRIGAGAVTRMSNSKGKTALGVPLTPNTPDNVQISPNINTGNFNQYNDYQNTPTNVAKATPRMMGSRNVSTSNTIGNDQYQRQQQQQQSGQPLMPPVDLNNSNNNASSHSANSNNTRPVQKHKSRSQEPPKQFHRKSLGDWDFLETVGAGSMGKVKLARHHKTNEVCAIKIVNRATKSFLQKEASLPPPKSEEEALERQKNLEKEISRDKRTIREASLGQILYHPHICRLFEICTMSNHFYMLFEYVSGGQLLDYIIQHGSLREHHARKFTRGIASALQYLHGNNIVHRDLKIENIMISTSGDIKIIDFGLSNLYDSKKQLNTFCGSLYFAAPELLKANPYVGPEVDIWSFGVVLYVLACGKVPFDDENSSVLHEKIKQGKVDYPQHLSIEVISLLSKMLVVDPKKRASLQQIVNHPWMTRGFDTKAPSYLPLRVPMSIDMINHNVVKEMFELEFIDDIEQSMNKLKSIVTDPAYVELSNSYWQQRQIYERTVSKDLSYFDDPTRAFHPLLSIYYLVDEMLRNKLKKLQRKQMVLQKQKQQELQQLEAQKQQLQNQAHMPELNVQAVNNKPEVSASVQYMKQKTETFEPTSVKTPTIAFHGKFIESTKQERQPLNVVIPPKIVIPEQAHTSPTSRKASDCTTGDLDYALSPHTELLTDVEPRINSTQVQPPAEQDDKSTFGGIFRRLSQRRSSITRTTNQQQTSTAQKMQPQLQIKLSNEGTRNPGRKTHQRTYSEHVPTVNRVPSFSSARNNFANKQASAATRINTNASPVRSSSHRQDNNLPALPSNAEHILQQQRANEMDQSNEQLTRDTLNIQKVRNNNSNNNRDDPQNILDVGSEVDDVAKPLANENYAKGRVLHPSARAKSVGHARRESLKFSRPPVPPNVQENYNSEYADDNYKNNHLASSAKATNQDEMNMLNIVKTPSYIRELTDQEILDEASKAPVGSMPSIDYPRSLFLKGFFSVQTTSSKPLPIVRYKIISVLKRMDISFTEVKGGFVCVQNPLNIITTEKSNHLNPPQDSAAQHFLQPPAATHRRISSVTPQISVRRQPSVKYSNQPTIPASPIGLNMEENRRSISSSLNAANFGRADSIGGHSGNTGGNSEDMSTASLDYVNEEDILTTSRVQDMNKVINYNSQAKQASQAEDDDVHAIDYSSKEKPPIKFEIYIVKVRIVGLAGVHFKKVSGNTWMYKELASHILSELNL